MSSPTRLLGGYVILLVLLLVGMASMGNCSRVLKEVEFKRSIQGMLPRGPVPPSGPSPCHNKLSPNRHTEQSYQEDYVICP
ncbi:hypothetical protein ACE6H2_003316 [Prunus campanulata]